MNTTGPLELRAGLAHVRLVPSLGGRITSCSLQAADGQLQDVLYPYPESHTDLDHWAKGGLYPLVPYSGRIRNAMLAHAGRQWPLEPYPGSMHTLHGIAHRRPWTLQACTPDAAQLSFQHQPDTHWPWAFEANMAVQLSTSCLQVHLTLRNTGSTAAPAGIGLHPYLRHDDDQPLVCEASAPWPFDADCLAMPMAIQSGTAPMRLGPSDWCSGEVTRFHGAWSGQLQLLDARTQQPNLSLHASGALSQLVIHRPAAAGYLCVEPVSHVPDGFNLAAQGQPGTGLCILAPQEQLRGTLRISVATASV